MLVFRFHVNFYFFPTTVRHSRIAICSGITAYFKQKFSSKGAEKNHRLCLIHTVAELQLCMWVVCFGKTSNYFHYRTCCWNNKLILYEFNLLQDLMHLTRNKSMTICARLLDCTNLQAYNQNQNKQKPADNNILPL